MSQQYTMQQYQAMMQQQQQQLQQQQQQQLQLQQQQQQQECEVVDLPADAYPGKEYTFTAQNGQSITFAVPAGMGPGMSVTIATGPQEASIPQQYASQYGSAPQQYSAFHGMAPQHTAAQHPRSESVTLPADACPGKEVGFQTQDGRTLTFSVPAGMGPGSVVLVTF